MRVLVVGAGVIGSVYAARLLEGGHEVELVARGRRFDDLRTHGLVLVDAATGRSRRHAVPVHEVAPEDDPELVLVCVRRDQLTAAMPALPRTRGDVVVLGNAAGLVPELVDALGSRLVLGFPAAGGVVDGASVRYVTIRQQRTMLGEPDGTRSARVRRLARAFVDAGFRVHVSADPAGWLLAHAAFVVPISFALYRVGGDPAELATDRPTLRLLARATREAFGALRSDGNREIPTNLRLLYGLPGGFAERYWRGVFARPTGELWFGAHARAAPGEMRKLAEAVSATVNAPVVRAPSLANLFDRGPVANVE